MAHKKTRLMLELHPSEQELILLIREKYRFGTIEIITHNGLPRQVLKTVERHQFTAE